MLSFSGMASSTKVLAFNVLTGIDVLPIGDLASHILGGLLGAASGAFGAYIVGGSVGFIAAIVLSAQCCQGVDASAKSVVAIASA